MDSLYLQAWKEGLLTARIEESRALLADCTLCPRRCGVDRLAGELGVCQTGTLAEIASYGPHFGEESVLVGEHGSGTIFFCGCSLTCLFCQNYDISHPVAGSCEAVDAARLGNIMVELQHQGCHNINLVTPSHVIPQILASLPCAIDSGLTVPLVYNCSGYEEIESLKLLEGIVDIYMPDFKFWKGESAKKYAHAADYPEKARAACIEMQRQVGDLKINEEGLAERGLMVRHLLMPHGQEQSREILRFLAESISRNCFVNIMDQYRPCGKIRDFPELQETIAPEDYQAALDMAAEFGLNRLDVKDFGMLMRNLFRT
ncbi:radical SAM protein [Desulfopila aestuarii]|uniref:Putative pyruvate formate lyase activating enzyme n=1 Tax=Desulfopila aestuarii DSM 18488 TaxID=1121416 RepID=A0A1M7Y5C4_9BACT|nr:radical SAM protein [Desulfopila aestuarii]SHO47442.1 putative pyruvate formate lyase activating enzyme [Desulfopila aestuarii DSM 18488]